MHYFSLLIVFSIMLSGAWAEPAEEGCAVEYMNPFAAMTARYGMPVDIRIPEAWGLTELQRQTASSPPTVVADAKRFRFVYPEDVAPTAESVERGAALSDVQRKKMQQARRAALKEAVWRAGIEAELYNKVHSAELAVQERQGLHIVINLTEQKGYYREGETELRVFDICSGKESTPTPIGHFHVQEKRREHRSNLYNNANMPYFMRLTLDGVGLHQGKIRSIPSSHGCVRLREEDARFLFENCTEGTAVFIEK